MENKENFLLSEKLKPDEVPFALLLLLGCFGAFSATKEKQEE